MTRNVTAQSRLLRMGRHSETGRIYLITITCAGRKPVFADFRCGRAFVCALRASQSEAITLCYVVMPDHVHWLMQLNGGADLSSVVQKVKSLTTRSVHELDATVGVVWQASFHDRALRREDQVKDAARYVVANPLRAGLVGSLREYALWDAVWV